MNSQRKKEKYSEENKTLSLSYIEKINLIPIALNLRTLTFDGVQMYEVPKCFKEIKYLISLTIKNSNLIYFPNWLDSIEELEFLNLEGNCIKNLPEKLEFKKLIYFYINKNKIKKIFFEIKIPELEELDVSNNKIKKMPNVSFLKKLKYFNINNNNIKIVDNYFWSLVKMENADFSKNPIKNFSRDIFKLENLKKFYMSGTLLRQVPETIKLLKNVEEIAFCCCHLDFLGDKGFMGSKELKEFFGARVVLNEEFLEEEKKQESQFKILPNFIKKSNFKSYQAEGYEDRPSKRQRTE